MIGSKEAAKEQTEVQKSRAICYNKAMESIPIQFGVWGLGVGGKEIVAVEVAYLLLRSLRSSIS